MKFLEADVTSVESSEVDSLRDEIRDLRRELAQSRAETMQAKRESTAGVSALRKVLSPLYRALQEVFGEMEGIGQGDAEQPVSARTSAMWSAWKDKLGKGPAKAIDALLLHGAMTRKQLAVATGYSPQNISNIISDLNGASLITKDGDRVSLRTL